MSEKLVEGPGPDVAMILGIMIGKRSILLIHTESRSSKIMVETLVLKGKGAGETICM